MVLVVDPTTPLNWFKVTAQTQYADGPDAGQPFTVLVDVSKVPRLNNILIEVQASADDLQRLRVEPNVDSVFTLKGQPRIAALWFRQMEPTLASEVTLPDLPRLQSVTLTLQLPQERPITAFYEVLRADAEGLHRGDSVYKKSK